MQIAEGKPASSSDGASPPHASASGFQAPSRLIFKLFSTYAQRYMRRHFHGVRLAGTASDIDKTEGPIIVYLNHPSWWDPLTCMVLASRFFPGRFHFAPIDARGLEKYPFFRRLGFFGVEPGTRRGATAFLRTSLGILRNPKSVLWMTAEGEFRDPRDRPIRLRPGLAHLVRKIGSARVIPLAVEYPFWQERKPETLVRFGDPIDVAPGLNRSVSEWQTIVEGGLERAMDQLAANALQRDPTAFQDIICGRSGVGGVYDAWRRMGAWVRGKRFVPEHGIR